MTIPSPDFLHRQRIKLMTNPLKKINKANILFFLSIIGPGIITANVDNDAGGIATYSVAGAQYGYSLLWSLIPMLVLLILIQEMVARLGVVTGKGLSDLIRERYGVKITFYTMLALLITNFGNITAEFAGLAASLEIFGVSRYISVPLGAAAVWYLVVMGELPGRRKSVPLCLHGLSFLRHLRLHGQSTLGRRPGGDGQADLPHGEQLYFHADGTDRHNHCPLDAVLPAGLDRGEGNPCERLSICHGGTSLSGVSLPSSSFSSSWSACAATLHANGILVKTAEDAAVALAPLAGKYASILFAIGLANASFLPPRSCRSARPTASAKAWGGKRASARISGMPRSSWRSIRVSSLAGAGLILHPRGAADRDHARVAGDQRDPSALRPHFHSPSCEQQGTHGRACERASLQRVVLDLRADPHCADPEPARDDRAADDRGLIFGLSRPSGLSRLLRSKI